VAYLLADEKVMNREFGAFYAVRDNYPKYVITLDKTDFSKNGIVHMNIIDFLMGRNCKVFVGKQYFENIICDREYKRVLFSRYPLFTFCDKCHFGIKKM